MVRDNRIKEMHFPQQTFATATVSSVDSKDSYGAINGELVSVDWKQTTTGSISLVTSGTGIEVFRRNGGSGTTWQHAVPREFTQSTTGSIAGASHTPFVINEPLILNAGSMASGTSAALDVVVRYI